MTDHVEANLAFIGTLVAFALAIGGAYWAVVAYLTGHVVFTFDHFLMTTGGFVIGVSLLIITVEKWRHIR